MLPTTFLILFQAMAARFFLSENNIPINHAKPAMG
jgi:hypothetical protein